jgi:hypothetical protein
MASSGSILDESINVFSFFCLKLGRKKKKLNRKQKTEKGHANPENKIA